MQITWKREIYRLIWKKVSYLASKTDPKAEILPTQSRLMDLMEELPVMIIRSDIFYLINLTIYLCLII